MSLKKDSNLTTDEQTETAAGVNIDMEGLAQGAGESLGFADTLNDDQLLSLCKERLCVHCPELAKVQDEKLRMAAETENLKKRLHREKEEFCKFATESVLEDLLPVLDNLDLALEHGRKSGAGQDLINGVDMTRKLFLDIISRHSLDPLGEAGEEFDPAWHEALGRQPDPDLEPGRVCHVVQKGYRLKGRLLRPAKVLISAACEQ